MYYDTIQEMKRMLHHLDGWLQKAAAWAQARKVDESVVLGLRLFPDQLPLSRQVQIACDTPKLAAQRITGKEVPSQADTEKTFAELHARIETALGLLDGFERKDFEKSDTHVVSQPRWEGKTMSGHDYFLEHAVPNFFFHVVTAYAILRHNGVELGKSDYLGKLSFK
jgi:uncharacterized protein